MWQFPLRCHALEQPASPGTGAIIFSGAKATIFLGAVATIFSGARAAIFLGLGPPFAQGLERPFSRGLGPPFLRMVGLHKASQPSAPLRDTHNPYTPKWVSGDVHCAWYLGLSGSPRFT